MKRPLVGRARVRALWVEFLRSLTACGLQGVRLAISDRHKALTRFERVLACRGALHRVIRLAGRY